MVDLQNHHFLTTTIVTDLDKNHQYKLKPRGIRLLEGTRNTTPQITHYLFTGYFSLQRRGETFAVVKYGRHYLNQVIKLNIINNGTNSPHVPPNDLLKKKGLTCIYS